MISVADLKLHLGSNESLFIHAQRLQKLIYLNLFTDCFMKIFVHSSEPIHYTCILVSVNCLITINSFDHSGCASAMPLSQLASVDWMSSTSSL